MPGWPGKPAEEPGCPGIPGDPGAPGIPGTSKGEGIPGTWVPVTPTFTSNPSSSSPEVLSESPEELDGDPLSGIPAVGIELGLPEDDAVDPELDELLELELEELDLDELDAEGIDGDPDLEELDADGMDGEDDEELELDDDGIEGDELLELELELDEAVGMDGELELLLWLVSVLQAVSIKLNADTVIIVLIGNRVTCIFIVYPCRVHD